MTERAFSLRPYQEDAGEAAIQAFLGGQQHALIVMPTGTGKTAMAAGLIDRCVREHNRPALFVAHRNKLVQQAARAFSAYGLTVEVEMGSSNAKKGLWGKPDVIVASVQTPQGARLRGWSKTQFGLIVTDEAHRGHKGARMHQNIYSHFEGYWHAGITATPDGPGGIGGIFGPKPCYTLKMLDAIADGWIVRPEGFKIPLEINLRDVRITGGDFNAGDLADRVGPLVEDIARHACRCVEDRYFCGFTPDVFSAKALAETMTAVGGRQVKYVAGTAGEYGMPRDESDAILDELDRGEIQGVICCDLLFEGWDCRRVSDVLVARPTKKRYRYAQCVGRATRPWEDPVTGWVKDRCRVWDFDWKCDAKSRDLCDVTDLFALDVDARVAKAAKAIVRKQGGGDAVKALEEAKEQVFRPKNLRLKLTGTDSHAKIQAYDPIGAAATGAGVKLKGFDFDFRHDNPPTPRQIAVLNHLGLSDMGNLSKWGASKLIGKWGYGRDPKLSTLRQHLLLSRHGIDATSMSNREASDRITEIEKGQHHGNETGPRHRPEDSPRTQEAVLIPAPGIAPL